jgi:hypothetical protein
MLSEIISLIDQNVKTIFHTTPEQKARIKEGQEQKTKGTKPSNFFVTLCLCGLFNLLLFRNYDPFGFEPQLCNYGDQIDARFNTFQLAFD